MELKEEHINRAVEVFTTYVKLQEEINENQKKLKQISQVQEKLLEKLKNIRFSEKEWINEISKEYKIKPEEITKYFGDFILKKLNKK